MKSCAQPDVLLVVDNPHDAELALRAWQRFDATRRVIRVTNGRLALDWLHAATETHAAPHPPLLVMLDWKLPLIDGPELLRALRTDERTCDLPVVVLTTCGEENELIESYRLGVASYVVKPVDLENLSAAVSAACPSLFAKSA